MTYYEILQRTGEAWEAYKAVADVDRGNGTDAQSKRCEALWAEFQEWILRLDAARKVRA